MPKKKTKDSGSNFFRYVRGLLGLFAIFALVLLFGSLYVRHMVLETLQARTLDSSSMLLARSLRLSTRAINPRFPLKKVALNDWLTDPRLESPINPELIK